MRLTRSDIEGNEDFYVEEIKSGKIFIYPTDTIYGIGCDASNSGTVRKVREIKKRDVKPFSVIVPDKDWILKNCNVKKEFEKYLDNLPGKFTLILKLREGSGIAEDVAPGMDGVGVRIPDNWFAKFLSRNDLVFVTTSVNISGKKPIANVGEAPEEIAEGSDYVVDDGTLDGRPSTLINLTKEEVEIIER